MNADSNLNYKISPYPDGVKVEVNDDIVWIPFGQTKQFLEDFKEARRLVKRTVRAAEIRKMAIRDLTQLLGRQVTIDDPFDPEAVYDMIDEIDSLNGEAVHTEHFGWVAITMVKGMRKG